VTGSKEECTKICDTHHNVPAVMPVVVASILLYWQTQVIFPNIIAFMF